MFNISHHLETKKKKKYKETINLNLLIAYKQ